MEQYAYNEDRMMAGIREFNKAHDVSRVREKRGSICLICRVMPKLETSKRMCGPCLQIRRERSRKRQNYRGTIGRGRKPLTK